MRWPRWFGVIVFFAAWEIVKDRFAGWANQFIDEKSPAVMKGIVSILDWLAQTPIGWTVLLVVTVLTGLFIHSYFYAIKHNTLKPVIPAPDEKQALRQVREYIGRDENATTIPFRTVGSVVTTSTATTDLFRIRPTVPIVPMTPFFVVGRFTKTGSENISLGLKLNKVSIGPTPITTEQKTGIVTWFIGADRMSLKWASRNQSYQTDMTAGDERPVAPINDIAFQGSTDCGTLTINEAWLFKLPFKY